jgi:hypothetical protein
MSLRNVRARIHVARRAKAESILMRNTSEDLISMFFALLYWGVSAH